MGWREGAADVLDVLFERVEGAEPALEADEEEARFELTEALGEAMACQEPPAPETAAAAPRRRMPGGGDG